MMKRKNLLQLLVGLGISAVALWLIFKDISLSQLMESFRSFEMIYLIPCLVVFYFGIILRGLRWQILFRPNHQIPIKDAIGGIFICFAFNSILPARAGEFARAWFIGNRHKTGFSTAFGTVVAERLLDILTLLPCLAIALWLAPISPESTLSLDVFGTGNEVLLTGADFLILKDKVVLMAVVLMLGIAFISVRSCRDLFLKALHSVSLVPSKLKEKVADLVEQFAAGLASLHSLRRVLGLFTLSFIIWVTNAASVMFLAWGFPLEARMDFVQAFTMIVIACIFIMVPAAPGYWGFLEAGIIFSVVLMNIHPYDSEAARSLVTSYAILLHLTQWLPIIAIGLPWAWFVQISLREEPEITRDGGDSA